MVVSYENYSHRSNIRPIYRSAIVAGDGIVDGHKDQAMAAGQAKRELTFPVSRKRMRPSSAYVSEARGGIKISKPRLELLR
jgi:hypothetical protein